MDWPWSKTRKVRCPDGTEQFVFRNIDHAFPFFFRDAKASAEAAAEALNKVRFRASGKLDTKIDELLIKIDEKNASVQAHLRAAYVLYSAAPCKKLDALEVAIERIRVSESQLRSAEISIRQITAILTRKGSEAESDRNSELLAGQLANVIDQLNRSPEAIAIPREMERVAKLTEIWAERND